MGNRVAPADVTKTTNTALNRTPMWSSLSGTRPVHEVSLDMPSYLEYTKARYTGLVRTRAERAMSFCPAFQDSSLAIDRSIDAPRSTSENLSCPDLGRPTHRDWPNHLDGKQARTFCTSGSLPRCLCHVLLVVLRARLTPSRLTLPPLVLCRRRRTTAHDRLDENDHLPRNATQVTRMHLVRIALCAMIGCCLPATAVAT